MGGWLKTARAGWKEVSHGACQLQCYTFTMLSTLSRDQIDINLENENVKM